MFFSLVDFRWFSCLLCWVVGICVVSACVLWCCRVFYDLMLCCAAGVGIREGGRGIVLSRVVLGWVVL